MKKLLSMLLVFVLLFSLTACGTTEEPAAEAPAAGEEATEATEAPATEEAPAAGEGVTIDGDTLLENDAARMAIVTGFDREFIVVDILGDAGSTGMTGFHPYNFVSGPNGTQYEGNDFRDDVNEPQSYDPEAAQAYWAQAKEELGFEFAEIELLNYDSESSGKIAEHIQEELERNLEGLSLSIKPMPFSEKLELADAGDFDLNFAGWGPDFPDPLTFMDMWITDGEYNESGWSNAEYDALIALAKNPATSSEDRWTALLDAENILMSEGGFPIVPMYQRGGTVLQVEDMTNYFRHTFGPDVSYKWVDKDADEDGKKVLTLIDTSDIPSMDPNNATDAVSFTKLGNTNETLFRLSEGDVPVPAGATGYEFDEATMTYTFHLNEDAVWTKSDGSVYGPVTAADYVYSWDRLQSEELAAQYGYMVESNNITDYVAVDDYTFNVTVSSQIPYFEAMMTFPVFIPVNEAFVAEVGSDKYGSEPQYILSNGPFYMSDWELGSHVQLLKNTHYWDADSVNLDEVYFRVINGADNNTVVNAYLDGEIDVASLSGENVAAYRDRDDALIVKEPTIFYLSVNVNNHGE